MSVLNKSNPFQFCIFLQCHNSPVNCKLIHFLLWINGPHQSPNVETFKCSGEHFPNSSCHFWKKESLFLQILYQYSVPSNMTSLFFFSSNIIHFSQRQPIKVQIFEIFEWLNQNSSNSSYQFWTEKWIPLQFLYLFSLSWQIPPL